MNYKIEIEFKKDTGYTIDRTNPNVTTYWHFYEEIKEGEYYRKYAQWLENNCALLTLEDSEYIYSFMPEWVKEQPKDLDAYLYGTGSSGGDAQVKERILSILKLPTTQT